MRTLRIVIALLCLWLSVPAQAQEMDKELSTLADKLAMLTKNNGSKKVTVLDFTDLQGNASELGRYVAEELTVNLVMVKSNFAVLDRANLRKILAEHKLTATGLVDPENAKKLGQFAGVDALILGNIIPRGQKVALTAKIISTETAEIVGAAKAEFTLDETLKPLETRAVAADGKDDERPAIIKTFGDLRFEFHKLKIVSGNTYLLSMNVTNQNPRRSVWTAISTDSYGDVKSSITDSATREFKTRRDLISGLSVGGYAKYSYRGEGISNATEIPSGESLLTTMKFISQENRMATPGKCSLQLELLSGYNFVENFGQGKIHNVLITLEAE